MGTDLFILGCLVFAMIGTLLAVYLARAIDYFLYSKIQRLEEKIAKLEAKKLKVKSFNFCNEKVLLEKIDSEIVLLRKKIFVLLSK
jgi:hypothetical protein